MEIRRAAERYRVEQPGIVSWHCFSSGSYFDPDNTAFGRLIACDEHLVAPAAGFADHAHAGTELISWVLDGTLAHRDSAGRRHLVQPGAVQYQATGSGIRHSEYNGSSLEPLRFIQLAFLSDVELPAYELGAPPFALSVGRFDILTRCRTTVVDAPFVHLFVAAGNFHVAGSDIATGDSVRAAGALQIDGDGELVVVTVDS
jgi:redox-sensitive bicupin YhaK (pirin superfamily)